MCAKLFQSCLTLCDPMDYRLPGSSIYGITQTRILEWVAISFSRGFSGPREWTQRPRDWIQVSCIVDRFFTVWATKETLLVIKVKPRSHIRLVATPWAIGYQAPLGPWDFPGKSTGVGCHFLLQGIFPTQRLNLGLQHCRQMLYHLSNQGSPC